MTANPCPISPAASQENSLAIRATFQNTYANVLFEKGLQLITPIRKNRHNRLLPLFDKRLLRRRSLIETINEQLKNISPIEHSPHRSIANFMVNLVAGLIAYTHQPLKPSLNPTNQQLILLDKPM